MRSAGSTNGPPGPPDEKAPMTVLGPRRRPSSPKCVTAGGQRCGSADRVPRSERPPDGRTAPVPARCGRRVHHLQEHHGATGRSRPGHRGRPSAHRSDRHRLRWRGRRRRRGRGGQDAQRLLSCQPGPRAQGRVLGTKVLGPEDLVALADLPSRDLLLAQLAGALQAPVAKLAGCWRRCRETSPTGSRRSSQLARRPEATTNNHPKHRRPEPWQPKKRSSIRSRR